MKKFFSAVAAGAKAMNSGPSGEPFQVAGRPVRCPHCSGEWKLGSENHFIGDRLLLKCMPSAFKLASGSHMEYPPRFSKPAYSMSGPTGGQFAESLFIAL
jgi:hypothetical protein